MDLLRNRCRGPGCVSCRWPGTGKGGFEEVFCVRLRWFLLFVTVGFLVFSRVGVGDGRVIPAAYFGEY